MKHLIFFKRAISIVLMLSLFSNLSLAEQGKTEQTLSEPEQLIVQMFNAIIKSIESNREAYKQNPDLMFERVDELLTPVINIDSIAKKILGRHAASTTAEQRKLFAEEFKKTLLNTYGSLLLDYNGQQLQVKKSISKGDDRMIVNTELVSESGEGIPIVFYMSNRGSDKWTARNLKGAGINFVSTFRSTFDLDIAKNGIDAVIKRMQIKNQKS